MVAENTRERILDLARNSIQYLGYNSFNYKQISTELNIKNAAIHYYFPVKEDLGLAVIERDEKDFAKMIVAMEGEEPLVKLEALINIYDRYFKEGHKMCLIGTLVTAYHSIPKNMQLATTRYSNMVNEWLTAVIQEGLDMGRFNFEGTAEDMANNWSAILPASLQLGRVRGETYFSGLMNNLRVSLKVK